MLQSIESNSTQKDLKTIASVCTANIPSRKASSLSPTPRSKVVMRKQSVDSYGGSEIEYQESTQVVNLDKIITVPSYVATKMVRMLSVKRRDFIKLRKSYLTQQNAVLDNYASLKDLENRINANPDETIGDMRVLSMTGWPPHDILLIIRDDLNLIKNQNVNSILGSHALQQLSSSLGSVPEEIQAVFSELLARRLELIEIVKCNNCKPRTDKSCHNASNMDLKTKQATFEIESEKLNQMVNQTYEAVKCKVLQALQLAKISWVDRDTILKRLEIIQKDNTNLQSKIEELTSAKYTDNNEIKTSTPSGASVANVSEELAHEHAACEKLKGMVTSAESMLRAARTRITNLERQLKDMRTELDGTKKKHKELEQLYRTRETSYDVRSRKLIELSKTGEITIDTLSRQRDALEMRVKELREQLTKAEAGAKAQAAMHQAHINTLQGKLADQEKCKTGVDVRVVELQSRVKELESLLMAFRERSAALEEMVNKRRLLFIPNKEKDPTLKEAEIWKELQTTRSALHHAEKQLRQSQVDKDNFLNSLARIAQGEDRGEGSQNLQEQIALELLNKEQQIVKLVRTVEKLEENKKTMEASLTHNEDQIADLRLEVRRLRNYDCFTSEVKFQELETQLLDSTMQIATLNRERSALMSSTAERALMLERYERGTALFANMIRMRKDLRALIDGRTTLPLMDESCKNDLSKSISSMCVNAADTWSALRTERTRVMRLEASMLTHRLQLERHSQVRTLLEQQRAVFERLAATKQSTTSV